MQSIGFHQRNRNIEVVHTASEMERRNQNRRQERREGFTYLPIVGWYCRREKARRNDPSDK